MNSRLAHQLAALVLGMAAGALVAVTLLLACAAAVAT